MWNDDSKLTENVESKFLYCPRRVLAQMANSRGGTLEAPAYREDNLALAGKILIFENMACKGLPKSMQRIAENLLGDK